MKKLFATIFALVILCTFASAQGPLSTETVTASPWDITEGIMVDGVKLSLSSQEYPWAEYVNYQGSIYLPLHTVEQLLGASSVYDDTSGTLALTLDQTPFVQVPGQVTSSTKEDEDYEEKLAVKLEGWETGVVEVELCSGVSLTLDGAPLPLYNAQGDSLYPLWYWDEFYLPIRSVSELMGYEILWVGGEPWTSPHQAAGVFNGDFDILYDDYQPYGENPCIYLYKAPTSEELEAAQSYLDQVEQIYIETRDTLQQMTTDDSGTTEEHIEILRQVAQQLGVLGALEPNFSPLSPIVERDIGFAVAVMVNDRIPDYTNVLGTGSVFDTTVVADFIDGTLLQYYYMIWGRLVSGQRILDAVVTATPTSLAVGWYNANETTGAVIKNEAGDVIAVLPSYQEVYGVDPPETGYPSLLVEFLQKDFCFGAVLVDTDSWPAILSNPGQTYVCYSYSDFVNATEMPYPNMEENIVIIDSNEVAECTLIPGTIYICI